MRNGKEVRAEEENIFVRMQASVLHKDLPYFAFHTIMSYLKHSKVVEYPSQFPDVKYFSRSADRNCPLRDLEAGAA